MALDNLLEQVLEERAQSKRLCKLGRALEGMSESDRTGVLTALEHKTNGAFTLAHVEIAGKLRANGYDISEYRVGDHRRGVCGCEA